MTPPLAVLSRPVRLRGRQLAEARRWYRVYLAAGYDAAEAYLRLRGEGYTPGAAQAWARVRAVAK